MGSTTASREMWTADGVELTTYGYNITSFAYVAPTLKGTSLTLPMRSGSLPRYNRSYEPGEFGLSMWVLGAEPDGDVPASWTLQRGQFETNLRLLMSVLCKQSAPINFSKTLHDSSVITSRATPTPETASMETQMGRLRGEVTFTFELMDSFWTETTQRTSTATAGATLPKTLALTAYSGSTAPLEDAVVTVSGPITNPRVTDAESGSWVQYTGSVPNGQNWVVDCGLFTSKVNGVSVRTSTSHGGHPRFLYIPPRYGTTAIPSLQLTGSAGGAATNLSVAYKRKFLLP